MKIKQLFLITVFSFLCCGNWAQTYSFENLFTQMQQNNPELLKLQEEYRRSLLDVKDAKAGLGPTVDFQASGTYMVKPPVGAM
nr:TolC family protein [Treponema sp.]